MWSRQEFSIKSTPRRQVYEQLIEFCTDEAATACVIDRFPAGKKTQAARERVLQLLLPHLIARDSVTEWPGSSSTEAVERWTLRAGPDLRDLILTLGTGLDEWQEPLLPEDLHFYRRDGELLLGSVAHEGMAWMQLTEQEAKSSALGLVEFIRD